MPVPLSTAGQACRASSRVGHRRVIFSIVWVLPIPRSRLEITSAMPNSPAFQAWRTHYRDNGMNAMVRELDRRVEENRAFSFPAEWPPNHAAGGAP